MKEVIKTKAGATISRSIVNVSLPTGSAWQARAKIAQGSSAKEWQVTMTLTERVGEPGIWDGTYVVPSDVTETFPKPVQGQKTQLYSDIVYFYDATPDVVVPGDTFLIIVEWSPTL